MQLRKEFFMNKKYEEVSFDSLPDSIEWVTASGGNGNCLYLGAYADKIALSKDLEGTVFLCTTDEVRTLIEGAKSGKFDDLIS